jgi:uncharacterized cupin superfamily protein
MGADPGWFIVNVADAPWYRHAVAGVFTPFEREGERFEQFGINIHVLEPGQPNCRYHREDNAQEAFLVLTGECLLIVEGEERRLGAWDFFHCPPGVHHVFVGAGDGPCAILMVGTRNVEDVVYYPENELAARYDAQAPEPTDSPEKAYSDWPAGYTPTTLPWPLR